jgi:biotin carboxylase
VLEGIKTNIPLHLRMLQHPAFAKADFYTKWIEEELLKTAKKT